MVEKKRMGHWDSLKTEWKNEALRAGFSHAAVVDLTLSATEKAHFKESLEKNLSALDYIAQNLEIRFNPQKLLKNAQSALLVSLPYAMQAKAESPISFYALGKDYHKVVRGRLKKVVHHFQDYLSKHDAESFQTATFRIFCDSAPVLEKTYAERCAFFWRGKNSLILSKEGSFFFLGGVLTNLPFAPDEGNSKEHCGTCRKCIKACPTAAILENRTIQTERCVVFWLNKVKGKIPLEICKTIGVRVYGCDACQVVCPWNKFAQKKDAAFTPQPFFNPVDLPALFLWDEKTFLNNLEGSSIRRLGFWTWQRNVAIALTNWALSKKTEEKTIAHLLLQKLNQAGLPDWLREQFGELLSSFNFPR